MTFIVVMLCILAYAGIGIVTGVYTRNRSVNKSHNKWLKHESVNNSEENRMLNAMKSAKTYDSEDWAMAGFLGGFFWPVFLPGFGFHWVYKKIESALQPHMPLSEIEKRIAQIHKDRALEDERKQLMREARRLGLDTKVLEKLGE